MRKQRDRGDGGAGAHDITNPRNPEFLSLFNGEDFGMESEHGHVHEFDLTRTPDGRTLALLASPDLEALTSNPPLFDDGIGDLLIVDITDPPTRRSSATGASSRSPRWASTSI